MSDMNVKNSLKAASRLALVLIAVLLAAGPAAAAEYWLCAGATTKTMPDPDGPGPLAGEVITVWGYARDNNRNLADGCGNPPRVPGPPLVVPVGDSSGLTVHLRNDLPLLNGAPVPVSIFIPGQGPGVSGGAPPGSFFMDSEGRERARSFTAETLPGTPGTYSWPRFRTGTYLYQSGSHPALQVQMGLYGMATKDAGVGRAYSGVPYDRQVVLLYSELDPDLHAAVRDDNYGPTKTVTSTALYRPVYYLVNGAPYVAGVTPNIPAATTKGTTLIRFVNAGLRPHAPLLQGADLKLVAEDGNRYTYPRMQYSTLLPAGKTLDAIFAPTVAGTYPIYDRTMAITNGGASPGGLMSFLTVTEPVIKVASFSSLKAEDGRVLESRETSGVGGLVNSGGTTLYIGDSPQDRQYRSLVSFYTAALPNNAVIVSATLRLKRTGGAGLNPFTTHGPMLVDIRRPFFGTSSALSASDFQAAAGLLAAGRVGPLASGGYHRAALRPAAYSHINRVGRTQMRLRFRRGDNDDLSADYVAFFSGNVAMTASRPRLVIQYYVP